jgi:CheY-like chemotaxis protein
MGGLTMRLDEARILFVDDEASLLEIFGDWLTGGNETNSVRTAADGLEALEMLEANPFDLLITDVNMPRMDGITLVRQLVQSGRKLPAIIIVSGFGNVDERELFGLGVEAFLEKPTIKQTLLLAVERALTRRSKLWQERLATRPRQSISIEAIGFADTARDGGIALGRGGFTAPYTQPVGLGRVSFDCHMSGDSRITGEGFIRWRSKAEGTIGIEFAFLEESCLAATAAEIETRNPSSFIPAL